MVKKEKMQVNDLIFKELIKRGYSIENGTRVWNIADSKLWYLTDEQAKAYLELCDKQKNYKKLMVDAEIELLRKNMPSISKKIIRSSEIVIVDIGCGDGKKAVVPIEYMKDKVKILYCPVDISSYMVKSAIKKISSLNASKIIEFKWNISDFENLDNVAKCLRNDGKELVFFFLGSTISNFETHETLYKISSAMESGEYLLLGIVLDKGSHKDAEKTYRMKNVDNFLGKILELVGFHTSEMKIGTKFVGSRVECYYTIMKDKVIGFQDKKIEFKKGDKVIVSYTYKFNKKSFENIVKLYFKDYTFYLNKEKTWALVLCKK